MRMKGSVTIENAVIIPVFVIIMVSLIMLDLYIHDTLIARSTALKLAVRAELEMSDYAVRSGADKDIVKKNLCDTGSSYASEHAIAMRNAQVGIQEKRREVQVTCSGSTPEMISHITGKSNVNMSAEVGINAPADFVRLINAVKNAAD